MGRIGSGITEASSTSYEITFTYRGERCRERIKIIPSPTNRRRVENHLGAIKHAIENGTFNYAVTFPDSPRRFKFCPELRPDKTLEAWLEKWLEGKKKQLKSSTYANYVKISNEISNHFVNKPIIDLKRSDIRAWLQTKNVGNKRLANIQSMLRTALQDAVEEELIEHNPLYGWKYTNKEAIKKSDDVDPFTQEEQALILENLQGQYKNMFQFFFWTGLRTSELVALTWDDIDFIKSTARINKAFTIASEESEPPKTRAGNRVIKLLPPAMEAIMQQKQYTALKNKEVFQNAETGERWNGDRMIRYVWERALKKAKVRYRRPYQTRHTYASMMLTAGEHPMWVADQMGHADKTMIGRVYGRFIPNQMIDSGQKAVAMFAQNAGIKAGKSTQSTP